ncbi:1-phosphatidylinositol 4,5-bisphosphate phosphodiesterase 1 [Trichomonascus vanleenenianus]|uniref:phosphatidylinositol phospholipase C n=1 Tax=Trichomonascus vanleenenianus TaxID=2268995 RepID=UPI003ECA80A9
MNLKVVTSFDNPGVIDELSSDDDTLSPCSPCSTATPITPPLAQTAPPASGKFLSRLGKSLLDRVGSAVELSSKAQNITRKFSVSGIVDAPSMHLNPAYFASAAGFTSPGSSAGSPSSPSTHSLDSAHGPLTRQKTSSVVHKFSTDSFDTFITDHVENSMFYDDDYISKHVALNLLTDGFPLCKITHRKRLYKVFVVSPASGIVRWGSKSSARLQVDRITEIRVGEEAANYREELKSTDPASRWASIIYASDNSKTRVLHVAGGSQAEFDVFINMLQHLVKHRYALMAGLAVPGDQFARMHWRRMGKSHIDFSDVENLARRLHINCSKSFLQRKFQEADRDGSGRLDYDEFHRLVQLMKARVEVSQIFGVATGFAPEKGMSYEQFERFVVDTQRQELSQGELRDAFARFCDPESGLVSADRFADMLVSSSLFPPLKPCQENLDRPITEYFVSSSHNTYLLGRQVAGASSVEAYIRALKNGCRCIEIDCWDGENGPIVCHGRTFTSSIDFIDAIKTIRKYGFISSPYPLILSLEVHCNPDNQLKMVEILTGLLGEQLITEPVLRNYITLPSPKELKHRILIKVKSDTRGSTAGGGSSDSGSFTAGSDTMYSSTTTDCTFSDESTLCDSKGRFYSKRKKKAMQTKIIKPLSELGVYVSGVKFRNFSLPVSKTANHCFSLSERIVNSMVKDNEKETQLEKHNRRYLMRVYPSGYRVTSKNFDPIPYWRRGVQMVALNWQTNDIGMQLNEALFDPHTGYVHKPAHLLNSSAAHHQPVSRLSKLLKRGTTTTHKVSLRVISAQQLARPKNLKADDKFEPYVTVELFGNNSCTQRKGESKKSDSLPYSSLAKLKRFDLTATAASKYKTEPADNGFNPVWNASYNFDIDEEDYDFTFLRFTLHCGDSIFACYTVRLRNLQQGFRHLPLHDLQGEEYIFSTLFINHYTTCTTSK